MCTPILIASAALAVGSAVANQVAHNDQVNARNDVLREERLRQERFDSRIFDTNTDARERFVGFEPAMAERGDTLGDMLGAQVAPDPNTSTGTILPSSSSTVVNQETANQNDAAQQYVDQQSDALGNMKSFGDLLGETTRGVGRDASKVNMLNSFKLGSSGVVPFELDKAAEAGEGWRFLGDILGGLGSVGMTAGAGAPETNWWTRNHFDKTGSAFRGGWGSSAFQVT
jgi:hypothetical protein